MAAALANKAIDGGSVNEPFATSLIEQAGGVRVASMDKFRPRFPAGYLLYGTSLTKANREAGRRYMIAYLRGLHDYKLAFGPEKKNTADVFELRYGNFLQDDGSSWQLCEQVLDRDETEKILSTGW